MFRNYFLLFFVLCASLTRTFGPLLLSRVLFSRFVLTCADFSFSLETTAFVDVGGDHLDIYVRSFGSRSEELYQN